MILNYTNLIFNLINFNQLKSIIISQKFDLQILIILMLISRWIKYNNHRYFILFSRQKKKERYWEILRSNIIAE